MKHLAKRTLSLLLAALMVLTIIPANPTTVHAKGYNIFLGYNTEGTLVSGKGLNHLSGATAYSQYYAFAIKKSTKAYFGLAESIRADFTSAKGADGEVIVEVEYYIGNTLPDTTISIAQNFQIVYGQGDPVSKQATIALTDAEIKEGTTENTQIARFTLTNTILDIPTLSNSAFYIENLDASTYLGIRSIRIIDKDVAPVFVTTTYPDTVYDEAFTDIKIGNLGREKSIKVFATIEYQANAEAEKEPFTAKTQIAAGTLPYSKTAAPTVVTKEKLAAALKNCKDGIYTVKVEVEWDDSASQVIAQEYIFTHINTITPTIAVYNGDVWYSVQKNDVTNAPNSYTVDIQGTPFSGNTFDGITDILPLEFNDNNYVQENLTKYQDLEDGIYTVGVASYYIEEGSETGVERTKDTVTFIKCEHTYAEETNDGKTCTKCGFVNEISSNIDLENTMSYNVYVNLTADMAKVANVQVTRNEKTGTAKLKATETEGVYYFSLPGLAAKELSDEFDVVITDNYGNKIGEFTESFARYAQRLLNAEEMSTKAKTMIADMIVYATKAQQYFAAKEGKEVGTTVADQMGDFNYSQYCSETAPTCTDNRAPAFEEAKAQGYIGTNFTLGDKITMNLFTTTELGYAEVSFNDHYEAAHVMTPAAEVKGEGYYVYRISEFVTADGGVVGGDSVVVTAKFYANEEAAKAEGATPILTVTDSMASYVARAIEANAENEAFLQAMMKFTTSSRAYFAE